MSRKRKHSINFWVGEEELIRLKDKMALASCNPRIKRSDYIRNCVLGKEIVVIPGIRDLINEIRRIGNNLNQITRAANEGSLTIIGDDLKDIKEDLKKAWERFPSKTKKI